MSAFGALCSHKVAGVVKRHIYLHTVLPDEEVMKIPLLDMSKVVGYTILLLAAIPALGAELKY